MVIAITGTIGSGKSVVGEILRKNQQIVIDCDQINANALQDEDYLKKIKKEFPDVFINGVFVKHLLAQKIFTNENERKRLNKIAHPYILKKLAEKINAHSGKNIYVEIPLLTDEFLKFFDKVVIITAPMITQLDRIVARDGVSMDFAKQKFKSQEQRLDFKIPVIEIKNDSDLESLRKKVTNALL